MKSTEEKLKEIAYDALSKRQKIIQKYKSQGSGNVVMDLPYNCKYLYGESFKNPEIQLNSGDMIRDMDFWAKTIWN